MIGNTILKSLNLSNIASTLLLTGAAVLAGCDSHDAPEGQTMDSAEDVTSAASIKKHAELFAGCYTVSHEEPAQIKVSEQAGKLVMQMKEPKSANRVWDDPEPLEPMPLKQVDKYFPVKAEDLTAMIGRPDRVLVMANVKQAYVNIDPSLDSPYLGYILQGQNTIYKVDCDDTPAQEMQSNPPSNIAGMEEVGNITIRPAGKVE